MLCLIFSKHSHLNGVPSNIVYGSHSFSDLKPGASLVSQRWSSLHIGGHFYFAFPWIALSLCLCHRLHIFALTDDWQSVEVGGEPKSILLADCLGIAFAENDQGFRNW